MKQSQKSKLSYDKILNAAIAEFGTKNYENASLNNICNDNNISKGLIYHNFENKDELYLCCVNECFKNIAAYLSNAEYTADDFQENMKKLLELRYQFFSEYPYYSNIFFNTVLQPPKHLVKQIKQIRSEFDEFNLKQYEIALKSVTLRDGITIDEAMEYFFVFQEMFNGYFICKAYENTDFNSLIQDHEMKLSKILNIMLYGIISHNNSEEK